MLDRVTRLPGSPYLFARVTLLGGLSFFHVNGHARVTRLTGLSLYECFQLNMSLIRTKCTNSEPKQSHLIEISFICSSKNIFSKTCSFREGFR